MEREQAPSMPPASYVNYLHVSSRREELHLSFGQIADGKGESAHLLASLVTTPLHARAMLEVLGEALDKYEQRFGKSNEEAPDPTDE